jgi:hypothetical protein
MDAHQLLSALGLTMGLPDLAFDANGCARLIFDQAIAVDLEHDDEADCIHIYHVLGTTPSVGDGENLYRRLLEGNLFGAQTQGAALSVDASAQEIVIGRMFDVAGASTTSFAEAMEKFLAAVEHWQSELKTIAQSAPASLQDRSGSPMPSGMEMMFRA